MTTRPDAELEFSRNEEQRLKARVKARLLGRPELAPSLGCFTLLRRLGQGAHGVVYAAEDKRSGATVAIKLLRNQHGANIARFKREFRGLSHLAHENLVQLHELFAEGDEWFFTMELVHGVPFTDYVRSDDGGSSSCDLGKLRLALIALLGAVQAVHDAGRLHCDLKPSNVLVTPTGRVVVLDFGLVTELRDHEQAAAAGVFAAIGTPTYMAPELGSGAAPTSATDAFAIGVMLSQALTASANPALVAVASSEDAETLALLRETCAGLLEHDASARLTIERALAQLGGRVPAEQVRGTQPTPISAFVGRERELSILDDAFARAQAGSPIAVFIHGPSGIGKTALCERFADALRGKAIVLRGRCHERESLPYKAFDGVVDALARELRLWPAAQVHALTNALAPASAAALVRVFPSLRDNALWSAPLNTPAATNPTELWQQAFSGMKTLLRGIAERKPLALIVDDLQWADLDSARLLFELLGPPAAPSLLYVGCYRSEESERSEFLREVLGPTAAARWQSPWEQVAVGALSQDDALALALRLLEGREAYTESVPARIARDSAGVPFLVSELARYFALEPHDREAAPSLSDLLSTRVSGLNPSARRALGLLALAGRPMAPRLLARALDDDLTWERSLRMLSVAGLLRTGSDGALVIYHDRLREQVVQLLSDQDRVALHRTLAATYEGARDSEPEWLIEHFRGAGDVARAFDYAVDAAALAIHKLAFNRGASLYRTALQLCDAGEARRGELCERLGDALVNAGRSAEAAGAFLEAVSYVDPDKSLALRCRAVQQYLRSGRTAEGHALLRRLLHEVSVSCPEDERALYLHIALSRLRLLWRSAPLHRERTRDGAATRRRLLVLASVFRECAVSEPLLGALFHSLFHEQAVRAGDPEALFMALAWDSYNHAFLGGFSARRRTARRLRKLDALAANLKSPYAQGTLATMRCAAALFEARHAEVDRLGRQAQEVFRRQCLGAYWEESVCATLRYSALEVTGPISALCDDAPQLLRRANESDDHFSEGVLSRTMSLALLAQDAPERALAFLADRVAELDTRVDLRTVVVTMTLADTHSYAGDAVAAWDSFNINWKQYTRSLLARSQYLGLVNQYRRGRLALSHAAATHSRAMLPIAEAHIRFLEKMGWPIAQVFAGTLRAALAFRRGDAPETERRLRAAADGALRLDMRMFALCVQRQLGNMQTTAEGAAMVASAEHALRAQGVMNPARWCDLLLPSGFGVGAT